jgi:hypothetical protein
MKRIFLAAALLSLLSTGGASLAAGSAELARKVTDMAIREKVETRLEASYWQATEEWIKAKNPAMTSEDLVALREAGKTEIAPAYDYVMEPAYEAVGEAMSDAEMTTFVDTYTEASKDDFRQTDVGKKFETVAMPAVGTAMNGPVKELIFKRLGHYRMAVRDKAIEMKLLEGN